MKKKRQSFIMSQCLEAAAGEERGERNQEQKGQLQPPAVQASLPTRFN